MSKYFYNENYFKQIDTEEKAYWLGFYTPMVVLLGFIETKNLNQCLWN